jgi:hypothetical protein
MVYSPLQGRLAQRESAAFTRQRTLVRSQHRPLQEMLLMLSAFHSVSTFSIQFFVWLETTDTRFVDRTPARWERQAEVVV